MKPFRPLVQYSLTAIVGVSILLGVYIIFQSQASETTDATFTTTREQNNSRVEGENTETFSELKNEIALLRTALNDLRLDKNHAVVEKRLVALENEMNALREQLQLIVQRPVKKPSPEVLGSEESSPLVEADINALMQHQQEQANEYLRKIDAGFESEGLDMEWSSTTSEFIHRTLEGKEFAKVKAWNVDCRSTLCRVEIEHDEADAQDFDLWLTSKFGEVLPQMIMRREQQDGSGLMSTIVYAARDGHTLPSEE